MISKKSPNNARWIVYAVLHRAAGKSTASTRLAGAAFFTLTLTAAV
jgi:hypothetical protein